MILLKDEKRCPVCGSRAIKWDQHKCGDCNTRLFKPESTFNKMKANWLISFWVFFQPRSGGTFQGWVHSTHLDDPQPNLVPINLKAPDKDYGMRPQRKNSSQVTTQQLGIEQLKSATR